MRLAENDIVDAPMDLPGWRDADGAPRKEVSVNTFNGAMTFINGVAESEHAARHHPESWNSYNRVRLTLSTYHESGVTEKDVAFARAVEESRNRVVRSICATARGLMPQGWREFLPRLSSMQQD